eukprot:296518-Prorocentrum_minimum.AAC.2
MTKKASMTNSMLESFDALEKFVAAKGISRRDSVQGPFGEAMSPRGESEGGGSSLGSSLERGASLNSLLNYMSPRTHMLIPTPAPSAYTRCAAPSTKKDLEPFPLPCISLLKSI